MSVLQVLLRRGDPSQPWGFRLQGGADFQVPLSIESVAPGSVADRCGLQSGDLVLSISGRGAELMQHEAAKMEIIRSGNEVSFGIQRPAGAVPCSGGGAVTTAVWRPAVTPVQAAPVPVAVAAVAAPPMSPRSPHGGVGFADLPKVTNTSLAPSRPSSNSGAPPGVSYNASPRPFNIGRTVTTTPGGRTKQVFHNNYNSPSGLYASGYVQATFDSTLQAASQDSDGAPAPAAPSGHRPVAPPDPGTPRPNLAGASIYCGSCGDMIKGVFVKVQGRVAMHPECLKCVKCGVGLRHCGYFYIDDKLYCETHAKQVAAPPEPGLKPVPVYK